MKGEKKGNLFLFVKKALYFDQMVEFSPTDRNIDYILQVILLVETSGKILLGK